MKDIIQEKVAEISVSYQPAISHKPKIVGSLDAYNVLLPFFPTETIALQERFLAMYVNRCNRVLGVYQLSLGGITGTVVDIRLLMSVALKTAATSIVLAHNHPSGNLVPSTSDRDLTVKIKEASRFLDIKLIDHLILAPNGGYYSFVDEGIL